MKKLVISALIAGISATAPLYAQTAAADSIEQQVFDKSFDVAVLSPQEMRETEGAFSFGTLGNGALIGAAYTANLNHITHYLMHGEAASMDSTILSLGLGAMTGAHATVGAAAENLTVLQALQARINGLGIYHALKTDAAILGASFPYTNSNN